LLRLKEATGLHCAGTQLRTSFHNYNLS
jgi:hypothetical protein